MDRMGTGLAPVGKEPHQAHLVGLDGRGMSGLAQMLVQRGFVVTGSVPTPGPAIERLRRLGVRVHAGPLPPIGPPIGPVAGLQPERVRGSIPTASRPRVPGSNRRPAPRSWPACSGEASGSRRSGGRRAGLAAAMVGWTLTHAGLDPTVVLGTTSPQLGGSGRLGLGPARDRRGR